ncbi:unnamed protein product [Soboliphyme baturini]|uniref:RunxI domain-containing protein n=1 Tax=Soboliphyme baturini TaxID=241478 RepID=A0A183JAU4_9BILA|nr:unnamed protein product [Soboliphyme baturini]
MTCDESSIHANQHLAFPQDTTRRGSLTQDHVRPSTSAGALWHPLPHPSPSPKAIGMLQDMSPCFSTFSVSPSSAGGGYAAATATAASRTGAVTFQVGPLSDSSSGEISSSGICTLFF